MTIMSSRLIAMQKLIKREPTKRKKVLIIHLVELTDERYLLRWAVRSFYSEDRRVATLKYEKQERVCERLDEAHEIFRNTINESLIDHAYTDNALKSML